MKRKSCKHVYRLIETVHMYSEIWGYDSSVLYLQCVRCGRKRRYRVNSKEKAMAIASQLL